MDVDKVSCRLRGKRPKSSMEPEDGHSAEPSPINSLGAHAGMCHSCDLLALKYVWNSFYCNYVKIRLCAEYFCDAQLLPRSLASRPVLRTMKYDFQLSDLPCIFYICF
jgi:hypothetical protein